MKPGEQRLRHAIKRRQSPDARSKDPCPYDDSWGWWIEKRLQRLENSQKWLVRIAAGILIAEIGRIALTALQGG